jgi:hypothetical protein
MAPLHSANPHIPIQASGCMYRHRSPLVRLLLAGVLVVLSGTNGGRAATHKVEADRFFGLTNVWDIHLTLTPGDWDALEPAQVSRPGLGTGQNGPGPGDRPRISDPDVQRGERQPRPREPRGDSAGPVARRGLGTAERLRGPGPGPTPVDYPWTTCTFECAGQTLTNVGIRFKGNSSFNSSRNTLKRPVKLDFDRHVPGREFAGLEELLLNNNFNDPTQMREVLAYDLFRRAGLPASRTAFARVWLTLPGRLDHCYLGLYTAVEPVEGGFLRSHFGSKKGLLVKPDGLRGLEYLGESWSAYTRGYDPKTKVRDTDARRLIAFARLIEDADDTTFAEHLGEHTPIPSTLRFLALNALLANMDSFIGNGHNYYLYIHPETGLANFIPWDLNEAFGRHPMAGSPEAQMDLSLRQPEGFPNTLVVRLRTDPKLASAYLAQCGDLLTNLFDVPTLHARIDAIAQATRAAVAEESPAANFVFERMALGLTNAPAATASAPLSGGDSPSAFQPPGGSLFRGPGVRVRNDAPLKQWIAGRVASATDQLAGKIQGTVPRHPRPGGPGMPGGPGGPGRPGGLGGPDREPH